MSDKIDGKGWAIIALKAVAYLIGLVLAGIGTAQVATSLINL